MPESGFKSKAGFGFAHHWSGLKVMGPLLPLGQLVHHYTSCNWQMVSCHWRESSEWSEGKMWHIVETGNFNLQDGPQPKEFSTCIHILCTFYVYISSIRRPTVLGTHSYLNKGSFSLECPGFGTSSFAGWIWNWFWFMMTIHGAIAVQLNVCHLHTAIHTCYF